MVTKTFVWDEINEIIYLWEKESGKVFAYANRFEIFWKTNVVENTGRTSLFEQKKNAMLEIEEQLRLYHLTSGRKYSVIPFSEVCVEGWSGAFGESYEEEED